VTVACMACSERKSKASGGLLKTSAFVHFMFALEEVGRHQKRIFISYKYWLSPL
jgi:hypothetical protein